MELESLDPQDWEETRRLAHELVDRSLDHTKDVRDRPIWSDMPDDVRSFFASPLPSGGQQLAEIMNELFGKVFAYPMGNIHPRFWAWYMGTSNITGAMADFAAAIQGSNLGGGNHAAALIDRQVVQWLGQMMGMPSGFSGTLVSGGSVANLIGLTVARNTISGIDIREQGVAAIPQPLRFYGSDQIHGCHQKALETLGLGNQSLPASLAMKI